MGQTPTLFLSPVLTASFLYLFQTGFYHTTWAFNCHVQGSFVKKCFIKLVYLLSLQQSLSLFLSLSRRAIVSKSIHCRQANVVTTLKDLTKVSDMNTLVDSL